MPFVAGEGTAFQVGAFQHDAFQVLRQFVEDRPAEVRARLEMDFGSGWVDVSEDVVGRVVFDWGIHGATPKHRTADPGLLSTELDNTAGNSGGVRGYYTIGHPDARPGFGVGTPVRLVLNNPLLGDRVKWVGTVKSAPPRAGVKNPVTQLNCADWLDEAALANVQDLDVQVDVQSDFLFETLVESVERQPPGGTQVGSGSDVYPFALDGARDEETRVLTELQKVALSEFGLVTVQAGVVVFEGRRVRGGSGSARFSLHEEENVVAMKPVGGREEVINRVKVEYHPRRVDSSYVNLFSLNSATQVLAGTEVVLDCPYRDPEQPNQRVSGINMQTPSAGAGDYEFNAQEDGLGLDLTDRLLVTADFFGNTARVTARNLGPSDGWIVANGLNLRGIGLYSFESVIANRHDQDSIDALGETVYGYDMPYQVSPTNADELAQFILLMNRDVRTRAQTVTFLANWNDACCEGAFDLRVSDRVSVTVPSAGIAAEEYFINGFKFDVHTSGLVFVTLDLCPVDTMQPWILEVDGRTELDETTVLGYGLFAPGWILDSSSLGSGTFLN